MAFISAKTIVRVQKDRISEEPDLLAVEEPLQIRLGFGPQDARQQRTLVVTMRTPGNDEELALGYLLAEGIIQSPADVLSCRYCVQDATKQTNDLRVELHPKIELDWSRHERSAVGSAACGLCGKTSIEAVQTLATGPVSQGFRISSQNLFALPDRLREQQRAFTHTGGLHAAALFNADGEILLLREDIGRHNALDKLIGAALWRNWTPASAYGVLVSGRVGYELVQKCWMAGVPLLAALGAPSSLAVEMAEEAGIALIGFLKETKFNVYTDRNNQF